MLRTPALLTGFSHRFRMNKKRGIYFLIWAALFKTWPRLIRSTISLLKSITVQLILCMLSPFSAQSLGYEHFSDLGVEISHRHVAKC